MKLKVLDNTLDIVDFRQSVFNNDTYEVQIDDTVVDEPSLYFNGFIDSVEVIDGDIIRTIRMQHKLSEINHDINRGYYTVILTKVNKSEMRLIKLERETKINGDALENIVNLMVVDELGGEDDYGESETE